MNRLEWWRQRSPRYPEDVARLRREIPLLADATDTEVADLYRYWSETYWCAGWLGVGPANIADFNHWLKGDDDDSL